MELSSAPSKCRILSRTGHMVKVVNVHVFFHTDTGASVEYQEASGKGTLGPGPSSSGRLSWAAFPSPIVFAQSF